MSTPAPQFQIPYVGLLANLPVLSPGAMYCASDIGGIFIGTDAGNVFVGGQAPPTTSTNPTDQANTMLLFLQRQNYTQQALLAESAEAQQIQSGGFCPGPEVPAFLGEY